ncbi:hypothetical protein [Limnospira platensis]|uniref:hypothetical protein n=1 Tax=Limnospira platensis TaxID=118562 RepID=UPI001377EEF8|nr:hypothetical protein [Arthrospira platensis FACHB-439]MDT9298328.1 hypothetical protein [Arthrospira platensis PCC 7345]QQW29353.1 hypothetical protein AP9108_32335 [Arthrospira sp. PCC 9108]
MSGARCVGKLVMRSGQGMKRSLYAQAIACFEKGGFLKKRGLLISFGCSVDDG